MKRTIVVLLGAALVAGCAGQNTPITAPNITAGSITEPGVGVTNAIKEIQTTATQVCSFLPTVNTVAGLLEAFGTPYVGMATDIASQICSAIKTKGARRGGARLRGVSIKGKFVR